MSKDTADLSLEMQRAIRVLANIPDSDINTDDIPEITDWSDAKRGVFYRPCKQQITLRLDADVVYWFKAHAREGFGYQTDINGALREHVHRYESESDSERSGQHSRGSLTGPTLSGSG